MSFYFYLNLAIIAFPLAFSFEKRIKFYTKIKSVVVALVLVGMLFVGWDVFATYGGHWSFNPAYVNETKILGLPLEEILFFVTVPYSCLFVFDSIRHFLGDKRLFHPQRGLFTVIGVVVALFAFSFYSKQYTFLAFFSVGLTIIFVSLVNVRLFSSRSFWIYILLTLLLFLVFNYFLTSFPVVQYSSSAITGFRITTIPIEDFLFNFSMLTDYLTVYIWAEKKLKNDAGRSV